MFKNTEAKKRAEKSKQADKKEDEQEEFSFWQKA